jgi:transcriptional regulatory protein RtcR
MKTSQPKNVVIGLLGSNIDSGKSADRWQSWRPTVSICRQPDFVVHRLELLYSRQDTSLGKLVRDDIASVSPETTVNLRLIEFFDPWDFETVYETLFQFVRSYSFDTEGEQYLAHITTGTHVAQICLFLLAESRHLPGKLLQCSPERERSAPGTIKIIDLDLSKYDRIASRFQQEQTEGASFLKGGIETRNPAFNQLIDRIEQVAMATRDSLLILGPTGAGKSRLARRIYELKKHRHSIAGSFQEVNCATLRGDSSLSTLFGHVKGAFTGAMRDRPGLLLAADKGMLFLDEVGELGLDEQAMLLRALEEKTFLPLGSDKEVHSDFQLIAGTNRDLQAAVREGRFREDLLARLNLWTFAIPGLRDRREDIEPNLQFELDQFATRTGRRITFNKEARDLFLQFALSAASLWTANFRDLNGGITRMATLAEGGRITAAIVHEEIARLQRAWNAPSSSTQEFDQLHDILSLDEINRMDIFDQMQLAQVVGLCRRADSLSDAGRQLFSVSRHRKSVPNDADRLRKYLHRFGLSWDQITQA